MVWPGMDAAIYGLAVRGVVSENLGCREAKFATAGAPTPTMKAVVRSAWMG